MYGSESSAKPVLDLGGKSNISRLTEGVVLTSMCRVWSRQDERDLFLPVLRFNAERTSVSSEQVRRELISGLTLPCLSIQL
jgi:hypothetical protein